MKTRREALTLLLSAAGLSLLPRAVQAQELSLSPAFLGIQTYRALLIAVQEYADPARNLQTPVNDAEALGALLETRYGFAPENIRLLRNREATRAGILDALDALSLEQHEDDAVLIFYAGHGGPDPRKVEEEGEEAATEGYWFPHDATLTSSANWVSNSDVKTRIEEMRARHVLLISDSCFSGALLKDRLLTPPPLPPDVNAAKLSAARKSRWVITSGSNEPVEDNYKKTGHSVFTYFLLTALESQTSAVVNIPAMFFSELKDMVSNNAYQQPQGGVFFRTGDEQGAMILLNSAARPPAALPDLVSTPAVIATPAVAATPALETWKGSEGYEMVRIATGSFWMGSPGNEAGRDASDEEQHRVQISRGYWMGATEVTQALYEHVMWSNPSLPKPESFLGREDLDLLNPSYPVQNVSWYEAVVFCNLLTAKENETLLEGEKLKAAYYKDAGFDRPVDRGYTGEVYWDRSANGYRLPSEAEWEYAARAGEPGVYAGTRELGELPKYANIDGEADGFPGLSPVKSLQPNKWGLYDMSGNVWEWCWDRYQAEYQSDVGTDPVGPPGGSDRVNRGGSWWYDPAIARVAIRNWDDPSYRGSLLGFRLARSLP